MTASQRILSNSEELISMFQFSQQAVVNLEHQKNGVAQVCFDSWQEVSAPEQRQASVPGDKQVRLGFFNPIITILVVLLKGLGQLGFKAYCRGLNLFITVNNAIRRVLFSSFLGV